MKHLLSILMLTMMLRVWWTAGFLSDMKGQQTGIVVGSYGKFVPGVFIVRLDNGKFVSVGVNDIEKSEFVEVK